jgi:hypothetical protein
MGASYHLPLSRPSSCSSSVPFLIPCRLRMALHRRPASYRIATTPDRTHARQQAVNTGQLNTILTFYEIAEPSLDSPLRGIPAPLLRAAIGVLAQTGRAQAISGADGDGARFFSARAAK